MKQVFNYEKQKVIRRDDVGNIKSIKPIYNESTDPITRIGELIADLKKMSSKFPGAKLQAEINAINDTDFGIIKDDLSWSGSFTDHGSRCYYQPTMNSVIILHKKL
tara:strand:+ start:141 stop:458 length:318 start_codon:yes stop_codon:yes gene_type:complete